MEVEAKVLATMREGMVGLHKALNALGKKLSKNFREVRMYGREHPVENLTSALESCVLSLEELAVTADEALVKTDEEKKGLVAEVEETKKELADVTTFAEETLVKFDRLSKGMVACPKCNMMGKNMDGKTCEMCEGQGYVMKPSKKEKEMMATEA